MILLLSILPMRSATRRHANAARQQAITACRQESTGRQQASVPQPKDGRASWEVTEALERVDRAQERLSAARELADEAD